MELSILRGLIDAGLVLAWGGELLAACAFGSGELLVKWNVRTTYTDFSRHGIGHIMELALEHLGPNTPIHLSFDVDALDPQWAPSTGMTAFFALLISSLARPVDYADGVARG